MLSEKGSEIIESGFCHELIRLLLPTLSLSCLVSHFHSSGVMKMGDMLTLYCPHCDYSEMYMLGIGMLYTPERVFYGEYDPELGSCVEDPLLKGCVSVSIYNTAKDLLSRGGKPGPYYGHHLYYCKKCKKVEERFRFSILLKNGEIYVPPYRCGTCHRNLIRIYLWNASEEDETDGIDSKEVIYTCPECGQACSLKSGKVDGMWD